MTALAGNGLNNVRVLLKSVLIDLRARNFVHAKTSLRARCVHARHRARNFSSPDIPQEMSLTYPERHKTYD